MKKSLICLLVCVLVCALLIGCETQSTREAVSKTVVDPTCLTEGYTETVYSDGYVMRDSFTPKTDHEFVQFSDGTQENVLRSVCRYCGMEKTEYIEREISTEVTIDPTRPRPSFAGLDKMICAMILENTTEDAVRAIRSAEANGAYGFMVYVSCLQKEDRTLEALQKIMYCTDLPVLAIAYNVSMFGPQNLTFDDMADLLRLSVEAGAAAVDLQAFLWSYDTRASLTQYRAYWEAKGFDMSFVSANPAEICADPAVLEKQRAFTDEIHAMGAEVLLSVHASVQMSAGQIVAMAKFMEAQGIDIAKIVVSGSSKDTVMEHLEACKILSEQLQCKFSVHGQSTLSRLMCPMFGSYIAFCVDEYTQVQTNIQIDLDTMTALFEGGELRYDLETLVGLFASPEMTGAR